MRFSPDGRQTLENWAAKGENLSRAGMCYLLLDGSTALLKFCDDKNDKEARRTTFVVQDPDIAATTSAETVFENCRDALARHVEDTLRLPEIASNLRSVSFCEARVARVELPARNSSLWQLALLLLVFTGVTYCLVGGIRGNQWWSRGASKPTGDDGDRRSVAARTPTLLSIQTSIDSLSKSLGPNDGEETAEQVNLPVLKRAVDQLQVSLLALTEGGDNPERPSLDKISESIDLLSKTSETLKLNSTEERDTLSALARSTDDLRRSVTKLSTGPVVDNLRAIESVKASVDSLAAVFEANPASPTRERVYLSTLRSSLVALEAKLNLLTEGGQGEDAMSLQSIKASIEGFSESNANELAVVDDRIRILNELVEEIAYSQTAERITRRLWRIEVASSGSDERPYPGMTVAFASWLPPGQAALLRRVSVDEATFRTVVEERLKNAFRVNGVADVSPVSVPAPSSIDDLRRWHREVEGHLLTLEVKLARRIIGQGGRR